MKKRFFNQSLKLFQDHHIKNQTLLTAVSGGLDSMVLMDLLKELSFTLKLKIHVIHIHHGFSEDKQVREYRDKAQRLVSKVCTAKGLPFLNVKNTKTQLKSEEEFRSFRHNSFKNHLKKQKADWIVLAHNQNDLLETRLIHLIRGCGSIGIKSMKACSDSYLRPLLAFSRQEIQKYAVAEGLQFLEDPSNKDNSFLRNWIRNQWLKDLEKKRPGALKALSRSLSALSLDDTKDPALSIIDSQKIKRKGFMELSHKDQKRALAFYMSQLKIPNYGQSHIEELLKHSQRKQKNFNVQLLKRVWVFKQDSIQAKKLKSP